MRLRYFFWILAIFIVLPFSNAVINSSSITFCQSADVPYTTTTSLNDTFLRANASNFNGPTLGASSLANMGGKITYDGTNDFSNLTRAQFPYIVPFFAGNHTLAFWYSGPTTANGQAWTYKDPTVGLHDMQTSLAGNVWSGTIHTGSSTGFVVRGLTNGVETLIIISKNITGTAITGNIYVNATRNQSISTTQAGYALTTDLLYMIDGEGSPQGSGGYSQVLFINKTIDATEAAQLWNSGAGSNCSNLSFIAPVIPTPINLTATATDLYDGSSLSNFSLSISRGANLIFNITTSNGTILVSNITNGMANLTFQSNQSGGYWEKTYNNVNVSGQAFIGQLYQGYVEFIANETITGRQLASFFVTSPLQTNQSYFGGYAGSCIFPTNCSGIATLILKAGNYNIVGNLSSYNSVAYLNTTQNITVSPMSYNRHSLTFGTNRLRIDARSIITNAYLQNFTILLYNGSYSTTQSTTTGNASFDILPGTWYMNFSSFSHASQNASIAIASGNFFPNYTFSIYTTNSINFTILDEQTGLTLSGLGVNIEIISDLYSQNFTTNSSFFYVDLLNPSDYLIRWSAPTYDQRTYYFSLTNGSNNQIYLYMLASNLSSQLLQQVIDQDGNNVVDAYIKVYRYFLANNAYSVREIGKTNSDGITGLNVILNDEFYYFVVQKPLGNTLYTTTPTYIYSTTTDAIQVNIGSSFAQKYFNTIETDYNLSFNPSTSSFRFFWDDPQGLVSEGCLNIYRVGLSEDTLVNSSCDTSSSSTIILRVANVSGATYRAEAFFGFSPADNLISELSYFFPAGNPIGAAGLLFVIFLTLVVFFISIMSGGLAMAVLLTPTPALFASLGGFIDVSASMVIPIQIAAMVVAYVISRR